MHGDVVVLVTSFMPIGAVILIYHAVKWYMRNGMDYQTTRLVRSVVIQGIAVSLLAGWFLMSRQFADCDFKVRSSCHLEWMWENRQYAKGFAGLLYLHGIYTFIDSIERFRLIDKLSFIGITVIVALGFYIL